MSQDVNEHQKFEIGSYHPSLKNRFKALERFRDNRSGYFRK